MSEAIKRPWKMKIHRWHPHGGREYLKAVGQSNYEWDHSTACGYVRENVTDSDSKVTCKHCLREMNR